jgi:ActR/RegA family two-component response regulator
MQQFVTAPDLADISHLSITSGITRPLISSSVNASVWIGLKLRVLLPQDLVMSLRLKQDSGLELVSELKTRFPTCRAVVLTGFGSTLAQHERDYIESVLLQCHGNISLAAKPLGIHRQSLQRKLRKFGASR